MVGYFISDFTATFDSIRVTDRLRENENGELVLVDEAFYYKYPRDKVYPAAITVQLQLGHESRLRLIPVTFNEKFALLLFHEIVDDLIEEQQLEADNNMQEIETAE